MEINVPSHTAVLSLRKWKFLMELYQATKEHDLLIAGGLLAESAGMDTEELNDVMKDLRRRGVVAYQHKNGAYLIRCTFDIETAEQFEKTMQAMAAAKKNRTTTTEA